MGEAKLDFTLHCETAKSQAVDLLINLLEPLQSLAASSLLAVTEHDRGNSRITKLGKQLKEPAKQ